MALQLADDLARGGSKGCVRGLSGLTGSPGLLPLRSDATPGRSPASKAPAPSGQNRDRRVSMVTWQKREYDNAPTEESVPSEICVARQCPQEPACWWKVLLTHLLPHQHLPHRLSLPTLCLALAAPYLLAEKTGMACAMALFPD